MKKMDVVNVALLCTGLAACGLFAFTLRSDRHESRARQEKQTQEAVSLNGEGKTLSVAQEQAQTADRVRQHDDMGQQRANHFDTEHQTWERRGGYSGARIPEDQFTKSFGKSHTFRMAEVPFRNNGGLLRFKYAGHWMTMMDRYPEYWSADWDQKDDMYVDYAGDGYYLYDIKFPGKPGVAISISN
ncbi:MAG: hypothetical protein KGN79_05095 [Acidobacteriota bacterium]|nr:hypothetical protein [Acidobacteriota bacterium]